MSKQDSTIDCSAICTNNGFAPGASTMPSYPMVPSMPQQQICSCYPVNGGGSGGFFPGVPGVPGVPGGNVPPAYPSYPAVPTPLPAPETIVTNIQKPKIECATQTLVNCDTVYESVPITQTIAPPPTPPSIIVPPVVPMPVYPAPTPVPMPSYPSIITPPSSGGSGTPVPMPSYPSGGSVTPAPMPSYPGGITPPTGGHGSSDCASTCVAPMPSKPVNVVKPTPLPSPPQIIIDAQTPSTLPAPAPGFDGNSCLCSPQSGGIGGGSSVGGGSGSITDICVPKEQQSSALQDCLTDGGINYLTVGKVGIPQMSVQPVKQDSLNASCLC